MGTSAPVISAAAPRTTGTVSSSSPRASALATARPTTRYAVR